MSSMKADARGIVAVVLLGALGPAACREPTVIDTTAKIIRTSNDPCADATGQAAQMDTYVLEMYEVLPEFTVSTVPSVTDCRNCIANPRFCRPEPPTCVCGGEFPANPDNLKNQVRGTRIRGLDGSDLYCLRLLAFENGAIGQAQATPCACDPEWTTPDFQTNGTARLCAISPPRGPGGLGVNLDVRCPSDDMNNNGGGGGGRNNNLSFRDCVSPPVPQ